MFDIRPHKSIKNLHTIVDNFHVFFNDGDNDILYTGTNKIGNRILGSIVFDDDENNFLRYYHTLLSDKQYSDFVNKRISLRGILKENDSFFAVDKDYQQNEIDFNLVFFSDIDDKFLPLDTSYCPEFISNASLEYTFSLKGGIADVHKADPEVMNAMNSTFCTVLKSSFEFVKEFGIVPMVFSEPAMTGSFELNFKMELSQPQLNIFSQPNNDIQNFIFKFFNYIFEKLPNEPLDVLKTDVVNSKDFKVLENDFVEINKKRGVEIIQDAKEQKIIDLITYSIDNFKDVEYKGFDRISISNKAITGEDLPIALINNNYYESIQDKVYKPEELNKAAEIIVDETPKKYSIQVYLLNKETGNGGAYYMEEGGVVRISLHLRGKSDYQNTIYTKNMNETKFIEIEGIGKKVDGRLKQITVTFNQ